MVRDLKRPDPEIKRDLYSRLNEHPLREKDLQLATGRSRPTLESYLFKGVEEGDIVKLLRTRVYSLTEKGKEELNSLNKKASIQRIIDESKASKESQNPLFRYEGVVDSLNEIDEYSARQYFEMLPPLRLPEYLPLPSPVEVGIYASREVREVMELAEDHAKIVDSRLRGVGPVIDKTVRKMIRTDIVAPFAKALLWDRIMERMWSLIDWHKTYEAYGREEGREKPPSYDLDYLLGFDLAVTMEYKGKELLQNIEERRKAGKRLAGVLLLRIGSGVSEAVSEASTYDVADFFDQAQILEKSEVKKLRAAFRRLGYITSVFDKKHRCWTGHYSDRDDPQARKIILEMACRYLSEGGILEIPTGESAESLAITAVRKPKVIRA